LSPGVPPHSSSTIPKSVLTQEKASVPIPVTTHVATVRHRASVPVNSQMARIDASTAMRMHTAIVQNENTTTR
jgi:hypothetical protein